MRVGSVARVRIRDDHAAAAAAPTHRGRPAVPHRRAQRPAPLHAMRRTSSARPRPTPQFFDAILGHWATHGFGYWVGADRDSGMPLGWVGVQRRRRGTSTSTTGSSPRRRAGAWPARPPGRPSRWPPSGTPPVVRALVKDHNTRLRPHRRGRRPGRAPGAAGAGRRPCPTSRRRSVFEAPRVERVEPLDDATARDDLLDLWCRVNDSGGAVGLPARAPRSSGWQRRWPRTRSRWPRGTRWRCAAPARRHAGRLGLVGARPPTRCCPRPVALPRHGRPRPSGTRASGRC